MIDEVFNNKCIGCSVVNGELVPIGGVICETKSFVLAQDPLVMIPGFLIIQSKKHINSLLGLNHDEQQELMELVCKAREAQDKLKICKDVIILQEERSIHFHVWLFPYYDWMKEKFGQGIAYVRDIIEYIKENSTEEDRSKTKETAEMVKDFLKKLK